ncbi:MAG TPA: PRC-barrel domain-containing protein [Allosphingosinicella sp.]
MRLISSDKVEGTAVVDRDGATLGHIKNFMVDKYTGRVAYAIMSFGGTMGLGTALFPLPWPLLDYDVEKDGYALDITKEQMAKAPRFEASANPEFTPEYRRTVISFYRPMATSQQS